MTPHRFADITQLADEFFELAPVGMAILRLEEPESPASFRILALNPAAQRASDVPTTGEAMSTGGCSRSSALNIRFARRA